MDWTSQFENELAQTFFFFGTKIGGRSWGDFTITVGGHKIRVTILVMGHFKWFAWGNNKMTACTYA